MLSIWNKNIYLDIFLKIVNLIKQFYRKIIKIYIFIAGELEYNISKLYILYG